MQTHIREYLLAIGLVLGCVTAPAHAQRPSPSSPPKTLLSFLKNPQILPHNDARSAKRRPASQATASPKNAQPAEATNTKAAEKEHPQTTENDPIAADQAARPLALRTSPETKSASSTPTATTASTN